MPRDIAYLEELLIGLARLRVEYEIDGKHVTQLLVQLEVLHEGVWNPARRYDDAHGQPHIDILDITGRTCATVWLQCTRNEAVTLAIKGFGENWRLYTDEFLER